MAEAGTANAWACNGFKTECAIPLRAIGCRSITISTGFCIRWDTPTRQLSPGTITAGSLELKLRLSGRSDHRSARVRVKSFRSRRRRQPLARAASLDKYPRKSVSFGSRKVVMAKSLVLILCGPLSFNSASGRSPQYFQAGAGIPPQARSDRNPQHLRRA
jgi:hypothetical protein